MYEDLEERAYQFSQTLRKVTIPLLMRKFQLTWDGATKLHHKICVRQHKEARKLAASLPDSTALYGWDAQLDRVKIKNLNKIKKCKTALHGKNNENPVQ